MPARSIQLLAFLVLALGCERVGTPTAAPASTPAAHRASCDLSTDEAVRHTLFGCLIDDPSIPARVMADAGWPAATPARRRELALAWLSEVEGDHIVEKLDAEEARWFHRADRRFRPPTWRKLAGGGLEVRYWLLEPQALGEDPMT